jgi:gas vesicle protein
LKGNRQLKWLVEWLLQSPHHSNRTAADAIALLRSNRLWITRVKIVAVAMITVAIFGWAIVSERSKTKTALGRVDELKVEVSEHKDDVERRDEKIAELKKDVERLDEKVAELKKDLARCRMGPPPPEQIIWEQEIAGGTLDEVIQNAADYLNDSPIERHRETIKEWHDRLCQLREGSPHLAEWFRADIELRDLLRIATYKPWESNKAITARAGSLNTAYKIWADWAKSDKSFADVTRHQTRIGGEVGEVLGKWLNDVENHSTLKFLITGSTSKRKTVFHLMSIRAGDASTPRKEWKWKTSSASGNSITLSLKGYKSGDPLEFWLEQDEHLWNTNVLHHFKRGPLAPWELTTKAGVRSTVRGSGYVITMRQTIPIGPPHLSTKKRTPPKPKPPSTGPPEDPVNGTDKTYDPLKELPINVGQSNP